MDRDEQLVLLIDAEFVDLKKLLELLKEIYGETKGKSNFRVKVWTLQYHIYLSQLTLIVTNGPL